MTVANHAPFGSRPPKIKLHHLDRWAIVYVRQSHPQQIQRHPESAEVQANLRQLALDWGWPPERVRVLCGDQGCTATTTVGRDEFAWLLGEISVGRVGLVLGFQVNRLVREDEACCRLIRICATEDTLIADLDGLYHPLDFNDRFLVTMKGIMGGIELHQIQQRMQAGRLNRARRGEWLGQPPPGYVVGSDRKLQFDPDEQVQSVIRLIFDRVVAVGSLSGLLRSLRKHEIQMPYRPVGGPGRGQLQWHPPQRETLRQLLRNPAFAGAYTWGRFPVDHRRSKPGQRGSGRVRRDPEACPVFLPDNHAAYITWEQFQSNRQRIVKQRLRGPVPGPARQSVAMLAGLVVCGVCGSRMQTHYSRDLRYHCQRHALDYGMSDCQSLAGEPLERLIDEQILEVVKPASLELSLRAIAEYEQERASLEKQWRLRLERAHHDTARAFRQYNAVEPENRLVARTLERRWEEALATEKALEDEHCRFQQQQPRRLTVSECAEINRLAHDLPALWHAPETGLTEKRHVVRSLVERVVVSAPATTQEVTVQVHWSAGTVTEHHVKRRVQSWNQVTGIAAIRERLAAWRKTGWSSQRMAARLNMEGHQTPFGKPFTAETVRQLFSRGGPERQAAAEPPEATGRTQRGKARTATETNRETNRRKRKAATRAKP